MTIPAIRGFNDILPGEAGLWRRIEDEAVSVFTSYGYGEIRLPCVEKTELFSRSIGETTDIVEKEMYTFLDRNGESFTLRPEGTASAVRAYIEHKLYVGQLVKLFYRGPMFRCERPQKGRYRQFHQIGAEVLGEASPLVDAETIEMLIRLFSRLGLKGISLEVNSLGCPSCRQGYKDALLGFLSGVMQNLCENCNRRIYANPLRALDCKGAGCMDATADAPSIIDYLCEGCKGHFDEARVHLKRLSVEPRINPRMVRGLDYYTKTTFEVTAEGLGAQNAIAAGGRYDSLVEELGGPSRPCFGFAIGVERLAFLLKDTYEVKTSLFFFIALGEPVFQKAAELISRLRDTGYSIEAFYTRDSLKPGMKRANALGSRAVLILGEDELKQGVVALKDMKTSAQERLAFDDIKVRLERFVI
ncbi:MAG: histidine--tRNA ligase [Deltaproteobacteria bacterium]|nr:histidine--tRNA ligase [Deltaproteobacteria bacterium]